MDPGAEAWRGLAARLCLQQRPPGLSVALVTPAGVRSEGFGLADIESARPVDADTVFLWFSMTKLVTATAVVQLADRGRLDLDAPVAGLVEGFPTRPGGDRVSARHLLSHSSGLSNPIPLGWVRPADAPAEDLAAFTARLLRKHQRLRARPGAEARYSNLGYLVLGRLIEAVSGASYIDYVRSEILEPLGMTATGFAYRADLVAHAATGYHPRFDVSTPVLRYLTPAGIFDHRVGRLWALARFCVQGAPYGGLIGPARDAGRFLALHLDPSSHAAVLSTQAVAAMRSITANGRALEVGLGWFRRHRDPRGPDDYWEHLGGGGGFFSTMRIYPERELGLVAMGNASVWDHLSLVDAMLGG